MQMTESGRDLHQGPPSTYNSQTHVVQVEPPEATIIKRYPARQAFILGIAQIVLGTLCFFVHVVGLCVGLYGPPFGTGIWCGALFIVAGSFGVVSSTTRRKLWIVVCMVLSIVSALATILIVASRAYGISQLRGYYYYHRGQYYTALQGLPPYHKVSVHFAMNGTLIGLALLEAATATIAAILCCTSVYCAPSENVKKKSGRRGKLYL